MLCYRCGGHVKDGSSTCQGCGQAFALGLKPGPIAGFGTGSRRHRVAIEGTPYRPGDAIGRRYQVKEHVGAGPVGWVYRVRDTEADVDVGLKIISPRFLQTAEERRAFFAEVQKARGLHHPNLVKVYDHGEDQERPFVAMQFLEGLTLRRIMDLRRQKGQGFTLKEVEPIVAQIAAALEAAGPAFAHGDLKPDNVMVLPDLLKLTDFGLAVSLPRAPFMAAQKAGGVHRYLAPEFLLGDRLDARTDVFALGVMLAEMLSGAQYEPALDLNARNPALPRGVQDIFRRAVAHKAHERYASAAHLADELSELLETGEVGPAPGATTRPNARIPSQPSLPRAASPALPPPMPQVTPPGGQVATLGSVAEVSPPLMDTSMEIEEAVEGVVEGVVIIEVRTDPRVRIARALAAQDEQIRADARKAAQNSSSAGAMQIPGTLQTPMLAQEEQPAAAPLGSPLAAAPLAALGKGGDVAEVAARVGATAELLTAETSVRAEPAGQPQQGDEPTQLNAIPGKRRGRGRREDKRHGRGRRGSLAAATATSLPGSDPEWALIATLSADAAAEPAPPPAPLVAAAPAVAAPLAWPTKPVLSFGTVEAKKKPGLQLYTIGGLLLLIAVLAVASALRPGKSEPARDEAAPPAAAAAAEKPKAPDDARPAEASPRKSEPARSQPAPAQKKVQAEMRPSRSERAERARRRALAEQRRQALLQRMHARREARTAAREAEKAAQAEKPAEPAK